MEIKILAFDIDGVVTDGTVMIDENGLEVKKICFRDLDAVTKAKKRGYTVIFISGEDKPITKQIADKFQVHKLVISKDKLLALKQLAEFYSVTLGQICYVGDGDYDAPALKEVGISFSPLNSSKEAKQSAKVLLNIKGGEGVIEEVLNYVDNLSR